MIRGTKPNWTKQMQQCTACVTTPAIKSSIKLQWVLDSSSYLRWNNKMRAGVCVCRGCVFMQNMWLSCLIRMGQESLPQSKNNHRPGARSRGDSHGFVFGLCCFSIWNQPSWVSVDASCSDGWADGVSAGGLFCEEGAPGWSPSRWGGAEADVVHQTEPGRPSQGVPEVNMNRCMVNGGTRLFFVMVALSGSKIKVQL